MLNNDQKAHEYLITLLSHSNSRFDKGFKGFVKDAYDIVELMDQESNERYLQKNSSSWILLNDKVPLPNTPVLAYLNNGSYRVLTTPIVENVVAWMYLPFFY